MIKQALSAALCGAGTMLFAADVYLCGDSIMADYSKRDPRPCYGWGEFIQGYCKSDVRVFDLAIPGSSTASWRNGDWWQNAVAKLQKGDFLLLGFGFNDGDATNPAAFCDETQFEKNLLSMAADVRQKGATPLFLTSTVTYQEKPEIRERHARYNDAVRRAAKKGDVELIDLNAKFLPFIDNADDAERYFVLKRQVPIKNWLDYDHVHLSENGARLAAKMVVAIIREKKLSLSTVFEL